MHKGSRYKRYSFPFTPDKRFIISIKDLIAYNVLVTVYLKLEDKFNVLVKVYDAIKLYNIIVTTKYQPLVRYNVLAITKIIPIQLYNILVSTRISQVLVHNILVNTNLILTPPPQEGYNLLVKTYLGGNTDPELFPNMGSNT